MLEGGHGHWAVRPGPGPGRGCGALRPARQQHLAVFHGFSLLFLVTYPFGMIRAAQIAGHGAAWSWQEGGSAQAAGARLPRQLEARWLRAGL